MTPPCDPSRALVTAGCCAARGDVAITSDTVAVHATSGTGITPHVAAVHATGGAETTPHAAAVHATGGAVTTRDTLAVHAPGDAGTTRDTTRDDTLAVHAPDAGTTPAAVQPRSVGRPPVAGRIHAPDPRFRGSWWRRYGGTRVLRRLVSGLLPLGLLVGLFVATVPDREVAAAPAQGRQPSECAALSSGSACVLGPLLRGLVRTAPLPRTPSESR
ncbi:protein of unknown function [Nocardia cyriacigeorgica GUH-2]|uniref:Uncharacterized protein n=1 Tax=Nocardia cyriacigeorgica (strain GUH-2) TaxID=1127134 RepID=H6R4Y6_NOCCG|nr:protein of unknown function [Nocardia cyriacigeorgica GUH-2]